jgi:hypothetical protein
MAIDTSNHRAGRVAFSSVIGIGTPPPPHSQASVPPPPFGSGGGGPYSLAREGLGGPNFDEGTASMVL